MNDIANAAPIKNRILIIDIVRGFALFGILLVNTPSLNTPAYLDTQNFGFQKSIMDQWVTKIIFSIAMESFYPIFALLFGMSAAIFLSKEGNQIPRLYLRRMFFLFCVGIIDALFVWWGDILIIYALLGSLLIFFVHHNTKKLSLIVSGIFLGVCAIDGWQYFFGSLEPTALFSDTEIIYKEGTFFEISVQRMRDYLQVYFLNATFNDIFKYFLELFGIMLLGMWAHKMGFLNDIRKNRMLFILSGLVAFLIPLSCFIYSSIFGAELPMLSALKGFCTGIFYICLLALISLNQRGFSILSPFAYNGRMSLSNYLGFNIVLSVIFYGYGMGLYGSLGPAMQMPIVGGLYVAFLLFSYLWLKNVPYGPLEYLWRLYTYGRLSLRPPFLKKS